MKKGGFNQINRGESYESLILLKRKGNQIFFALPFKLQEKIQHHCIVGSFRNYHLRKIPITSCIFSMNSGELVFSSNLRPRHYLFHAEHLVILKSLLRGLLPSKESLLVITENPCLYCCQLILNLQLPFYILKDKFDSLLPILFKKRRRENF